MWSWTLSVVTYSVRSGASACVRARVCGRGVRVCVRKRVYGCVFLLM